MKYKILKSIAAMAAVLAVACGSADAPEELPAVPERQPEGWFFIDTQNIYLYLNEEASIAPSFSDEKTAALPFVWKSTDESVVRIVEDNRTDVRIRAVGEGNARVVIEYADQTQTLVSMVDISVKKTPLRILAIGNSFSEDAVEQYLYELFEAVGQDVIIGNMYVGGCTLAMHWNNASNDLAPYNYRKIVDGIKTKRASTTLRYALTDEKWDYITLQEGNTYWYRFDESIAPLLNMVEYVGATALNADMKLLFHQSWSDSVDSTDGNFQFYGSDQMQQYNIITDDVKRVVELGCVDGIIPSGTAIQNARTSFLGDTFNRDGHHLEKSYGRYTVACTWFETISGRSVVGNSYAPDTVDAREQAVAQNAAHLAVQNPFVVADMSDYK